VFRAASKVLYDPVHDARNQQIAVRSTPIPQSAPK